jgi:hypothetical protein
MTKKMLSIASLALVVAVLVPLSVTTSASEVNCRVPFSFIAGGQTMAPGLYSISTRQGYMLVRGSHQGAMVLTLAGTERADGHARLVFLKTGERYDLSEVWTGDGSGLRLPPSKRQVNDRVASSASVERVVILGDVAAGSR